MRTKCHPFIYMRMPHVYFLKQFIQSSLRLNAEVIDADH